MMAPMVTMAARRTRGRQAAGQPRTEVAAEHAWPARRTATAAQFDRPEQREREHGAEADHRRDGVLQRVDRGPGVSSRTSPSAGDEHHAQRRAEVAAVRPRRAPTSACSATRLPASGVRSRGWPTTARSRCWNASTAGRPQHQERHDHARTPAAGVTSSSAQPAARTDDRGREQRRTGCGVRGQRGQVRAAAVHAGQVAGGDRDRVGDVRRTLVGSPIATRVGNVMSEPPPATALTVPAAKPAARSAACVDEVHRVVAWQARRTSRSGGRVGALRAHRRGTSGLHRAGWLLTATRGDPRDSATENRPPPRPRPRR